MASHDDKQDAVVPFDVAGNPASVDGAFAPSLPRKELTGNVLSLHDAEMQLIKSGPLGMKRLASARALDMQEMAPSLSDRDAQMIGAGYVMLRVQGMNGELTETTRAEVMRLEAMKRNPSDDK